MTTKPLLYLPFILSNCMKKYQIIYADPPWNYNSRMALGKGAKKSSVDDYYKSMTIDEIKKMPILNLADKNCILFLWVTMPKLNEVFGVIDAWGFTYKTVAFTWVKRNKIYNEQRSINRNGIDDFMGQGRWTRGNSELCLLATKGNIKRLSAKVRQIIYTPISEHSEKPNEVRNSILELCGNLPKIELFARNQFDGWDVFGNEVENSIDLSLYSD